MARFEYSATADALYIKVRPDLMIDRTTHLEAGTLVDLSVEGQVVGVEIIRPARPWPLDAIESGFKIGHQDMEEIRRMGEGPGFAFSRRHLQTA